MGESVKNDFVKKSMYMKLKELIKDESHLEGRRIE